MPEILRRLQKRGLVSPTRYEAYGLNVHESSSVADWRPLVSRSAGVAERYPADLAAPF